MPRCDVAREKYCKDVSFAMIWAIKHLLLVELARTYTFRFDDRCMLVISLWFVPTLISAILHFGVSKKFHQTMPTFLDLVLHQERARAAIFNHHDYHRQKMPGAGWLLRIARLGRQSISDRSLMVHWYIMRQLIKPMAPFTPIYERGHSSFYSRTKSKKHLVCVFWRCSVLEIRINLMSMFLGTLNRQPLIH